jgi:hypothetical protein
MEKQIVDIEFEDRMTCIGQIREDLGHEFIISVLDYAGDGLWDFSEELENVPKECISGFYDTTDLEKTGLYERTKTGLYELIDESDNEYVLPSDTDDDSGSDVSLEEEF